ncbi:MAG: NAD(P)-dependent oxidoreductase, partial [Cyanobacteria bacterium J06632_3]
DIVISMVTDDAASKSVWLTPETGAVYGLRAGAIAIESSTLSVDYTQELEQIFAGRGFDFLIAPVVGSRPQAEAQRLIYLVGGNADILAKAQPVLSINSGTIYHLGSAAQVMAMKLAVNSLLGIQVAALAEALGLLSQYGLSLETAANCLVEMPVVSPAAKGATAAIVADSHAPLFPIQLVEKDFRYAMKAGKKVQADMPVVDVARQRFEKAIAQGYGDENISAVARLYGSF